MTVGEHFFELFTCSRPLFFPRARASSAHVGARLISEKSLVIGRLCCTAMLCVRYKFLRVLQSSVPQDWILISFN